MTYPPQGPYGQQPGYGPPPQQQPGYGPPQPPHQQGGYQQPGYPGGEPPKKKTGPVIAVVVAVVVILAAVGITGFWQPGFFLADESDSKEDTTSSAPQTPAGSEPQGEGNGQPPKPDIQTPGGGQLPPEGEPPTGGEGGAEAVLAKAKAFVDAYNSRNQEAMVATTCSDASKIRSFDLKGLPSDAKMSITGDANVTGDTAKVPVEISQGGKSDDSRMPLRNESGGWCVSDN